MNLIIAFALAGLMLVGCAGARPQAVPPAASASAAPSMPMLDEHMSRMQEQMRQIQSTRDPAARRRLMEEHHKSMERGMQMMSGMSGGRGMSPGGQAGPAQDSSQRMQMMEMRMEMMHKMMEQMLQHEGAEHK